MNVNVYILQWINIFIFRFQKTGTNSVHTILKNTHYNHITANTIKMLIGEEEYHNKISFCFIRNPVVLVKSWYYYHKYSPNVKRQAVKSFYPDTIDEWVIQMNCRTHWEDITHKRYNPNWDLRNPLYQFKWIIDSNNNIIVSNVYKFDYINKHIFELFGECPKVRNKSSKDDYNLSINTENRIKQLFHKDIELYNSL